MQKFWLLKSEPETFSIDDLITAPHQTSSWEGVRNFQARNMLRDQIKRGDQAFFYHSNCAIPGIVGIVEITKEGYPDATAFDPQSPYYDPKSVPNNPRWYMVDVCFKKKLKRIITLIELKQHMELKNMPLVKKGNRLSVMPVSDDEWTYILTLE